MSRARLMYWSLPLSLLILQSCDGTKSPAGDSDVAAAQREAQVLDSIESSMKPCETAFAYASEGSTCFREIFGTPRWGWSVGSLTEGKRTLDLYAGAGQCDLSKGTKVGTVSVQIDGGQARVSLTAANGFRFAESHLYLGATPLPLNKKGGFTVAPGLFPYSHGLDRATSDSFDVAGVPSLPNMVLHVVSCGEQGSGVVPPTTTPPTDTGSVPPSKKTKEPPSTIILG